MILVVGGTGLVGNEVCQRLVRRGETVEPLVALRVLAEKVEALRSSGVELCVGDLKDYPIDRRCSPRRERSDLDGFLDLSQAARDDIQSLTPPDN